MRVNAPILVLWGILSLGTCGGRQTQVVEAPPAPEVPSDVQAAIEQAVEQYRQAHEVHSSEALGAIYARGLDVAVVAQGRSYHGWTEVEAYFQRRVGLASKVRMTIRELSVVEVGSELAIAHARLESTIGDDSSTVTERGVVTLVFRKAGEQWMVVAEHFSYPSSSS